MDFSVYIYLNPGFSKYTRKILKKCSDPPRADFDWGSGFSEVLNKNMYKIIK
jgi:hypothetical protein